MSTDKENHKSDEMKVEEKGDIKPDIKKAEANDVEKELKDDNGDKSSGNESEPEPEKKESPRKSSKVKEAKKEEKSEEEEDEEEEEENDEDKDGDEEDDNAGEKNKKADKDGKAVPLLDQPLQVSGARERKKVERFTVDKSELKEITAVEIPEGKGVALGNIGIIENNICKHKGEDLKKFHHVLFGRPGKATLIKKNIRKFNGFDFDKNTEQYDKKKASLAKIDVRYLKDMASILDLVKGGTRDELVARLLDFLMEPKGSGASAPVVSKGGLTKGGRPKRSAAAKANNKGYSESDGDDEEDRTPRSRRSKGKRPNLKDESSSEDEKVKKDDDDDDNNEKGSDVEVLPEEETPSSDESDGPKSKKKRAPPPKVSAKKSEKKSTPAKKEKTSPKKRKAESEEEEEEDESSEDDQPLVKKAKTPPTDDDIKTYVKEILEGANLEEITMKTVCKQVYSHYPEFDLAHKKDFIKTTVKSLIST